MAPRVRNGSQGAGGAPRLKRAPSAADSTLSFANFPPEAMHKPGGPERTEEISLSDLSPVEPADRAETAGGYKVRSRTRKRRPWPAALALGALLAVVGVGWFASSKARVSDGAAPAAQSVQSAAPVRPAPVAEPPAAPQVPAPHAAAAEPEPMPAEQAAAAEPEPIAQAQDSESAGAPPESPPAEAAPDPAIARAEALVDGARTLYKRKKYAPAKARYREALKASPDYAPALVGLTQLALRQRDAKQAVLLAKQLVGLQPEELSHQVLLGDAYKIAGKRKEAREAWKAAARAGSAEARARLKR